MSAHPIWSWEDVPGLRDWPPPKPPQQRTEPRRRGPGAGRPRHPVSLGHHDETILPMAQRGDTTQRIAAAVGCCENVVKGRLRVLERDGDGR